MSEQQPAPTELRFRPVASDGPRSVHFDTSLADAASAGGAHHRMNNWLAVWLVTLVAASLIPLASARPAFWMASAVLIALIGLWYALSLLVLREHSRILLRRFWFEAVLFAALCLYLAAQLLPIGRFVPIGFTLSDGTVLSTSMLSLAPGDTWLMLISVVGYGLFFALFLQVAANRRRARRVLVALLAIATAEAIYSLVSLNYLGDTLLGLEKTAYLGFATGTFVNRNSLATFLAAGLTIGAALLFGRPERDETEPFLPRLARGLAIVAALAFIAAALFASGSRMGALVGALGVVSVTIIGLIARPRLGGLLWVLALLALGAVGLFVAYGTGLVERMMTLRDASENRGELYRQVWEMIMLRPWLGYGGGSFPVVFPIFEGGAAGPRSCLGQGAFDLSGALGGTGTGRRINSCGGRRLVVRQGDGWAPRPVEPRRIAGGDRLHGRLRCARAGRFQSRDPGEHLCLSGGAGAWSRHGGPDADRSRAR